MTDRCAVDAITEGAHKFERDPEEFDACWRCGQKRAAKIHSVEEIKRQARQYEREFGKDASNHHACLHRALDSVLDARKGRARDGAPNDNKPLDFDLPEMALCPVCKAVVRARKSIWEYNKLVLNHHTNKKTGKRCLGSNVELRYWQPLKSRDDHATDRRARLHRALDSVLDYVPTNDGIGTWSSDLYKVKGEIAAAIGEWPGHVPEYTGYIMPGFGDKYDYGSSSPHFKTVEEAKAWVEKRVKPKNQVHESAMDMAKATDRRARLHRALDSVLDARRGRARDAVSDEQRLKNIDSTIVYLKSKLKKPQGYYERVDTLKDIRGWEEDREAVLRRLAGKSKKIGSIVQDAGGVFGGTEVFQLRDGWHLIFKGAVASASWADKGAAEAQLDLLKKGYSILTPGGGIKHVGVARDAAEPTVREMRNRLFSLQDQSVAVRQVLPAYTKYTISSSETVEQMRHRLFNLEPQDAPYSKAKDAVPADCFDCGVLPV